MARHITHDPVYDTVADDDFPAMLESDRYGARSGAFDEIISLTHDHFWDPMDPAYLDYATPFDMDSEYLMPRAAVPELNCAVADRLDEGQQVRLANEIMRWNLSGILHGEQGALSLSAGLCRMLKDPGAQEYAANQTREEARHVTAFSRYIAARWGRPYPIGDTLGELLAELVAAPEVYKKLVGMQMLVEGLAMGSFAFFHAQTGDPLLKRLTQLVMTDEAFHHRFGKIWAERTMPALSAEEHDRVEDWAARCFETLLFNMVNVRQRRAVYPRFGLDWEWVRGACREVYDDSHRRDELRKDTSVMRVLVKTLVGAGIVTRRTRHIYGAWVDMGEIEASGGHDALGEAIAAEGIDSLRAINRRRKVIGQKPVA